MTIFHERWWLDAVAPSAWSEVSVEENGVVVGRFPFYEWRRFGRRCLGMPPLTRTLGPAVKPGGGKDHTERQKEARIVGELIRKLPKHAFFKQILPPNYGSPLPFQFEGFSLSCEYVYTIDCQRCSEAIWLGLPTKTRTMIRRSRDVYDVRDCSDIEEFASFYEGNLLRSGRRNHFDLPLLSRVYSACTREQSGRILSLYDSSGFLTAAIFIIWSCGRMHFLLQTRWSGATNGAIELLVWEACCLASRMDCVFDLDGVSNETAARRMSQFGGDIRQRTIITRGAMLLPSFRHLHRELRWRLGRRDAFV